MRVALDQRRFVQTTQAFPLPSPTGGWNARSSLATMEPLDAKEMVNWNADEDAVRLRKGDTLFASGMSGAVETLFEYVSSTNDLLAASDGNIYDITSGTPSVIGSGFTQAQWQTANYNGRGFFVNGDDAPQSWNGTTLSATAWIGPTSISDLINVNPIRNRLWFAEKGSALAWYSGVGAITGALSSFDLGQLTRSGNLMQCASWSRDSGAGMDDFTVFIMETGEILVYSGDPATTFTLIGKYNAPKPIGRRCTVNWGGELVIITRSGYLTLTSIMEGRVSPKDALSEKIRRAVVQAVENGGSLDGWSVIFTPEEDAMIFNVPVNSTTYHQHRYNVITGAWNKWEGRDFRSMTVFDNQWYGGFDGEVYRMDDGTQDNSANETTISGKCQQAYNSLVDPRRPMDAQRKSVTGLRPFLKGTGFLTVTFAVYSDFNEFVLQDNLQTLNPDSNSDVQTWDELGVFNWEDWEFPWGAGVGIVSKDLAANAAGETFSVVAQANTSESLEWFATDIFYERGGV